MLYGIEPQGERPELSAVEAAREVLHLERQNVEHGNRLAALHHEIEQLELWGNVRLQQIEDLRQAGIDVQFYAVPDHDAASIAAECVAVVGELPDGRTAVATASRGGKIELPESAVPLPLPPRDAPSIRAEAAQIDGGLKAAHRRLAELAHLAPPMHAELAPLERHAEFVRAQRGGVASDQLFAVQGWLPAEQAPSLPDDPGPKKPACGSAVERADRRRTTADVDSEPDLGAAGRRTVQGPGNGGGLPRVRCLRTLPDRPADFYGDPDQRRRLRVGPAAGIDPGLSPRPLRSWGRTSLS